jgi:signal transduction histidine kinase
MPVMLRFVKGLVGAGSIRTRVLAIVLVPSLLLLGIGVGAAVYLFNTGARAQDWARANQRTTEDAIEFVTAVEAERRLSLLTLAGDPAAARALPAQRVQADAAYAASTADRGTLSTLNPAAMAAANAQATSLDKGWATMRADVDAGRVSAQDAYAFYNQLVGAASTAVAGAAESAPNGITAAEETTATDLLQLTDMMSRGDALAIAAITSGGLDAGQFQEYATQVGGYQAALQSLAPRLTTTEQAHYATVLASSAWQELNTQQNAILARGPRPSPTVPDTRPLPLSRTDWQQASQSINTDLLDLWRSHHVYAEQFAVDSGHRTAVASVWGGIAALVVALAGFAGALQLANRLIRRLRRLRAETLELAETRLPRVVERLREGGQVDLARDVPPLAHGRDEIGQVAEAFNKAQHTAVAAAVAEARTREGVNAVFLNLAHRSQVVVHRQLELLDKAEYRQEDPDQLELLFQLDHLATRARRNAENLIILGGEQPRRQWRHPVALTEIVRSAAAETEDYVRIRVARMADVSVAGSVVADLVHLLAELLDNATSFSPPESRVDVSGNQAGKGVVVEITDQGLGMSEEDLARFNAALREPPEFSAMDLSSDSRLGLFVVGRLAHRHGISVRLAESDYGGVRAIALIPSALLAAGAQPAGTISEPAAAHEPPDPLPRRPRMVPAAAEPAPVVPEQPGDPDPITATGWPTEEPSDNDPPQVRDPAPAADTHIRHTTVVGTPPQLRRPGPPPTEGRPQLPRRTRQANLAPQLAALRPARHRAAEPGIPDAGPVDATLDEDAAPVQAAQTRDLFAAVQIGTRQARLARGRTEDSDPSGPGRDEPGQDGSR